MDSLLTSGFVQVFADIEDDQFDFHGYCLRKCTLREYKK